MGAGQKPGSNLTEGGVLRTMVAFALPYMLADFRLRRPTKCAWPTTSGR